MPKVFESLFILALDEDEGYIVESVLDNLEAALAGAVLVELALQERIELRDSRVLVSNQFRTGHPILDKGLYDILHETRLRKPRYWINTLACKKLFKEIGYDLVDQGVLSRNKKRLRLVDTSGVDQAPIPSLKYSIKSHLREIVLAGGTLELADQVLLSFLYHTDLLRLVFTDMECKTASKTIKKLLKGGQGNGGLSEILQTIVVAAGRR